MIDTEEALRFLDLLGKEPARTRLRFFPHKRNPRKKEIGAGRKISGIDAAHIEAEHRQQRGAYLVVNDGGDSKASITGCVALFVEWDDKPIEWQRTAWRPLGLPEPSIQVETGGKSMHTYWVLKQPIPRSEWEPLQARLIEHCGSDPVCKDASRVMRLPGAWYIGPDGQRVAQTRIISAKGTRYDPGEIVPDWDDEFSDPEPEKEPARHAEASPPRSFPPRTLEEVREALLKIPAILPNTGQRSIFMKLAWGLLGAVREAGEDVAMALALLEEHSPQVSDAADYLKTEPLEITAASFWKMARDAGWRPANAQADPTDGFEVIDDDHQGRGDQQQGQQKKQETDPPTYSELLALALAAVRDGRPDAEMSARAEIMARFRRSDAQITKALFDLLTRQEGGTIHQSTYKAVDLDRIAGMDWLIEGFIPANDQVLLYGEAGAGKTTAAVGLSFAVIEGTGFLDRASCTPRGSVLFMASDSGATPVKELLQDMGLMDHQARTPTAPDQFIIWAHDGEQGAAAWDAGLSGCIALLDFVRREGVALVVIDSAKSRHQQGRSELLRKRPGHGAADLLQGGDLPLLLRSLAAP